MGMFLSIYANVRLAEDKHSRIFLVRLARDKHSSLLRKVVNYGRKKFFDIGTWTSRRRRRR